MLSSRQNPLAKQIRQLHQGKGRRELGAFLLEGSHLLQEALATGHPLEQVCATPQWCDRHPDLVAALVDVRLEILSPELLEYVSTTVRPDGVLAIAPRRSKPQPPTDAQLLIAVETLQDPGNLGTIIRTAAAAGADGVWLSDDSVDPESPKVLRASAGQWFRQPVGLSPDLAVTLRQCQAAGMQIAATLPRASHSLWDTDLARPTVILLGNEGAGLSEQLAALADCAVTIPQAVGVESLNVAISGALLLYEARRQRLAAAGGHSGE